MLHNLFHSTVGSYVLLAATAAVLALIATRLTEHPERKRVRKMLKAIADRGFTVTDMQLSHEGNPARYDEANDLVDQSKEPAAEAERAFKEGLYGIAAFKAARALELLNKALNIQSK
jgi:HEPN domain-containing protein